MTILSEQELRERLGTVRRGAVVEVGPGVRLTPAADDLVRAWELELREVAPGPTHEVRDQEPAWDAPGRFPVVFEGDPPACVTCGAQVRDKPNHLTQLDGRFFAPKTDLRVRLRGRLDSLQALTLLVAARAGAEGWSELAGHLGSVAAYCRELLAAEYHLRPPGALVIAGLDEAALHHASHHPEEVVGLDHLVPDGAHPEVLHWLGLLRCQVREAEIVALDAFPPEHHPGSEGGPIAQAVNRLSSAIYYLELRAAAAHGTGGRW